MKSVFPCANCRARLHSNSASLTAVTVVLWIVLELPLRYVVFRWFGQTLVSVLVFSGVSLLLGFVIAALVFQRYASISPAKP